MDCDIPVNWAMLLDGDSTGLVEVSAHVTIGCNPDVPEVTEGTCVKGEFVPPTITLPDGEGLIAYSYAPNPIPESGGPVTVTATLAHDLLIWGDTTGWTVEGNTATRVIDVPSEPCPDTPTPTTPPNATVTSTPTSPAETPEAPVSMLPSTGQGSDGGAPVAMLLLGVATILAALAVASRKGLTRQRR
jgi:hypothetical protein